MSPPRRAQICVYEGTKRLYEVVQYTFPEEKNLKEDEGNVLRNPIFKAVLNNVDTRDREESVMTQTSTMHHFIDNSETEENLNYSKSDAARNILAGVPEGRTHGRRVPRRAATPRGWKLQSPKCSCLPT